MSNRRIIVRVNHLYFNNFSLYNGVPQGSPISIIIFLVAYNRLCSILSLLKEIDFCAYADDFNLIIESSRDTNLLQDLDNVFANITD